MQAKQPEHEPIAHAVKDGNNEWRIHPLDQHLRDVATLAFEKASPFHGAAWAQLAGQWHDLGKYRPRFQSYIRKETGYDADAHISGESGKAPHSTAGAVLACERFGIPGRVLAYLIAGHHAGLHDWHRDDKTNLPDLATRIAGQDAKDEFSQAMAQKPPADILAHGSFTPDLKTVPGGEMGFPLWVRMLFSCLIDADRLDTEQFMAPEKAAQRGGWPAIPELLEQFNRHMQALADEAKPTPVNQLRQEILAQCRAKACDPAQAPGLFSLTVPTGGGKTLSSLAFALEHAARLGKRRIIYAIPFTSIIEQTADIFREIFGDAVIEHHSNAEAKPEQETHKSHLACENWDAPIIVTTNVQFFESLFAAHPSRCRKLHNIADSVVVLDEAQLLPPEFLQPILHAINLLAAHYGVTFVLSTATQPALGSTQYFDPSRDLAGLANVREIMQDPDHLYRNLDRVTVQLPPDWETETSWQELARHIAANRSSLAIVSRRADAKELWQAVRAANRREGGDADLHPDADPIHLSALMCGQHRTDTIAAIKQRLRCGILTRVVSTQLVEAGVDLDFPLVYRAMAGLDSLAQAAGRCNREGKLERGGELVKGELVVFNPPKGPPAGLLRQALVACRDTLAGVEGDPLERELFHEYFLRLYHECDLDRHEIAYFQKVDDGWETKFRSAAEKFRLIQNEASLPVVARYRGLDGKDETVDMLLGALKKDGPERWLMRKLQRYTVNVHSKDALRLLAQGDVRELIPGLFVQVSDFLYDTELGLQADGPDPVDASFIF